MAFPAFAIDANARKCWGKKGVINSQPIVASKITEVEKRIRYIHEEGGISLLLLFIQAKVRKKYLLQ